MRLTLHRTNIGVTPEGIWLQKVEGEWIEIPQPEWSKKKAKKEKVTNITEMRMQPPKNGRKPKLVKVYRVMEKTVPDYEAEVLCRNGWQNYYPGTLRHNEHSAGVS